MKSQIQKIKLEPNKKILRGLAKRFFLKKLYLWDILIDILITVKYSGVPPSRVQEALGGRNETHFLP